MVFISSPGRVSSSVEYLFLHLSHLQLAGVVLFVDYAPTPGKPGGRRRVFVAGLDGGFGVTVLLSL